MSKGGTPAMWPKPGIVPGSTSPSVHHSAGISAETSTTVQTASDAYERAHDPMIQHLPECWAKHDSDPPAWCICDELRSCEVRVREEATARVLLDLRPNLHIADLQGYNRALRDAVEAIKMQTVALWSHPRDGTERTAIWLDDGIAAIQALREKQ